MIAAATLTGVVGAATASAAPASPSASASSSHKKKEEPRKEAVLAKVAKSLGVSVKQLVTALDHLKAALAKGVDKEAAVAAFAKELKVTVADAEKALQALSAGDKESGVPAEAVKLLAKELHISADAAKKVFAALEQVKANGEDIVKDPAFVAIAKSLGISPERLLAALIKVKQELAGKAKEPKEKAPGGSPAK
jgi:transcription initiation factor TFIIIB Brf1 subunit/transcription initiation factor TFIIB